MEKHYALKLMESGEFYEFHNLISGEFFYYEPQDIVLLAQKRHMREIHKWAEGDFSSQVHEVAPFDLSLYDKTTKVVRTTREVAASHRVMDHESKCRCPHGHAYFFEVEAIGKKLDSVGRVVDFGVLSLLDTWLQANWDHNTIYNKNDKVLIKALFDNLENEYFPDGVKLPFLMESNPTAENMGHYLLRCVCPALFKGHNILVTRIRVYETRKCYVDVTLE